MDKQLIYKILTLLKHNGNVFEITSYGYEFGQIAFFLDELQSENYIQFNEEEVLEITQKAKDFIREYKTANSNGKRYSKWILPDSTKWFDPIDKFDVYITK